MRIGRGGKGGEDEEGGRKRKRGLTEHVEAIFLDSAGM